MSPTRRALCWFLVTVLLTVLGLMVSSPRVGEQWPSYNGDLVEVTDG
jgi:hypothetical protein